MTTTSEPDAREAFAERLVEDVTRSLETLSVYLGVKLGLYRAVADLGAATDAQLAARSGIAERYAREWLEQQAGAGYLDCDDPGASRERRFRLAPEHAEVLLDPDSPYHAGPGVLMFGGVTRALPRLLDAYRTGGGVPYHVYGDDIRRGIAAFNRPLFRNELAGWLAAVPDLDGRLRDAPPARVLDLGCGLGQSSIALARAYPRASVVGVDLDQPSVVEARKAAAEVGVADRVTFAAKDAADVAAEETYHLVMMFEALHDMGDPVAVLRAARSALTEDGSVLIGDERVADEFTAPAGLLERFQFGWSVLHCLPATIAEDPVEANGTMLRSSTVARWAHDAGFTRCEILPIENDFWRFYRLRR